MTPTLLDSRTFFGRTVRSLQIAEVTLAETVYKPSARLPVHEHQRPYVCFVLAGEYEERFERREERTCRRADIVFHPAGAQHSDRFGARGGRCLNVELGEEWEERIKGGVLDQPIHGAAGALSGPLQGLHRELWKREPSALVIEGLVLTCLGELIREPGSDAEVSCSWLERCLEILSDRFAEQVSLSELAAEVGVHPSHLTRVFPGSAWMHDWGVSATASCRASPPSARCDRCATGGDRSRSWLHGPESPLACLSVCFRDNSRALSPIHSGMLIRYSQGLAGTRHERQAMRDSMIILHARYAIALDPRFARSPSQL